MLVAVVEGGACQIVETAAAVAVVAVASPSDWSTHWHQDFG